ncbi:MAG: hydroxyisourate hydrolase [Alphaproteobacteria bacterium]|nr:hydroxyisourate hydrolase [Alphaproteobacteria bacterium]
MAGLSTHVLDTAQGGPAAGVRIVLFELVNNERRQICDVITNDDGRTDDLLIDADQMRPGIFELVFHVGAYFADRDPISGAGFLDLVPVRFTIADPSQHYHVPLLVSPGSYTTYRGS